MTPIAYVLFVAHYSINIFYADDWSVVPFVNAALRGHLTLSALWAQHIDHRMLFPNLVFVGLDTLTRANTVVLIALSAAVFIASYGLFLGLYRSYQSLTPLAVLTFGIVWFSIADYQNALWAFQFAWYFILLCLIGMLHCLQTRMVRGRSRPGRGRFVLLSPGTHSVARGGDMACVARLG